MLKNEQSIKNIEFLFNHIGRTKTIKNTYETLTVIMAIFTQNERGCSTPHRY